MRESDDSNITINWEDLIKDDENRKEDGQNTTEQRTVQIEESSRVLLESVFLLVCLIMITLGKNSGGQVRMSRATLQFKVEVLSCGAAASTSRKITHSLTHSLTDTFCRFNPYQPVSTSINPYQPVSTRINPYQPI